MSEWFTTPNQKKSYTFLIKSMYVKNMRLKLDKNYKAFEKHKQAEFQIITWKNCFYKKIFYQTRQKI